MTLEVSAVYWRIMRRGKQNRIPFFMLAPPLTRIHSIVDDDGRDVEVGQPGEVWVRGPVTCNGYYDNPKANAESFVDGWFCTGDIGLFKDGMIYIVDRKKVGMSETRCSR